MKDDIPIIPKYVIVCDVFTALFCKYIYNKNFFTMFIVPDDIDSFDCGHGKPVARAQQSEKYLQMECVCDPGWMPNLDSNGAPLSQKCTGMCYVIMSYNMHKIICNQQMLFSFHSVPVRN